MKRRNWRGLLSALLCLVLVVGLLPTAVLAGTSKNVTITFGSLDLAKDVLLSGNNITYAKPIFLGRNNSKIVLNGTTIVSITPTTTSNEYDDSQIANNKIGLRCQNVPVNNNDNDDTSSALVVIARDGMGIYYAYGYYAQEDQIKYVGGDKNTIEIATGECFSGQLSYSDAGTATLTAWGGGGGWKVVSPKVTVAAKDELGSVTVAGDKYHAASGYCAWNTSVTLTPVASPGYHFVKWSDDNTENPRTVAVKQDVTYTAEFAVDQASDSDEKSYSYVADALDKVTSGTITAKSGMTLASVTGGTLKSGVTLKTDRGTFTANGNANINMDSAGNVTLVSGKFSSVQGLVGMNGGTSVVGKSGKTITNSSESSGGDAQISVNAGEGGDTVTVAASGGKVSIDGAEYTTGEADTGIEVTDSGSKLTAGAVTFSPGVEINVGNANANDMCIKGTGGAGSTVTVTASNDSGESTVTVSDGGKVEIDGTEYAAGEDGATIVAGGEDGNKLTGGSATLNADVNIAVNGVKVKNTGSGDTSVVVSANGGVKVPAGGAVDIGDAKITDTTGETAFTVGSDGETTVTLPAGSSVAVNGVTYTDDGSGTGRLTINGSGKASAVTGGAKAEISAAALASENFAYGLISGVPVTVDKYIYTALEGALGGVTVKGRGEGLNPAIVLANDQAVKVELSENSGISSSYTGAAANTMFAMSADDKDATMLELLDNGSRASGNSALTFTGKDEYTVNGIVYAGRADDSSYTVTFGEAQVVSGSEGDAAETVNRNTVAVAVGSKVRVTMNEKDTIQIASGRVGSENFTNMPFTAANKGASILIDNSNGENRIDYTGSILTLITDGSGNTGYRVTRRYGNTSGSYIETESTKNGEIVVSLPRASEGATVTLTVKPDSGYVLDSLSVLDADGSKVKLTKTGDNEYTFTMPAISVSVEASFVKAGIFADVPESAYYYDAVQWAVENGITTGTGAATFSPNASCTRAQMVTFLYRAAGSPKVSAKENPFADVSSDSYCYDAVLWAVENGITMGTSGATFSPDDPCTRAHGVTFLYRLLGALTKSSKSFDDVVIGSYYEDAIAWAVSNDVTVGTSASTFSPDSDCTRAQLVTFLYRAYQGQ